MSETLSSNPNQEQWTRADLVAVAFAFVFPTIVTLVYFQWLKEADSLVQQIAMGCGKILQFGFPLSWVWLRHRDKLKWRTPVPWHPRIRSDLLMGVCFGALVVLALYGIYYLFLANTETGVKLVAMVEEKVVDIGINSVWKYVGMSLAYALIHTFLEEYYWRWFVFDILDKFVSTAVANILSSLGFMAHHVVVLAVYFGWSHPMTYVISFCVAIGGSFWAWQFKRTGTLFVPWLSHLMIDAGIFSLGFFLIRDAL